MIKETVVFNLSGAPQGESSGCFGNQKKKKAMAANQANTGTM